ncbi:hypothetical protein [Mycobacterium phage WXIN]|nr:hypothetical protein [Mycobacterium phage WXIN]
MGYNTSLTILNDGFDQLEHYPDDFVEGIKRHMNRGGSFGVGNHCNVVDVQPTDHADATQLIAVGGNFSTKVHTGWYVGSHHTEDGQIALLRQWADSLGYRIAKKPG